MRVQSIQGLALSKAQENKNQKHSSPLNTNVNQCADSFNPSFKGYWIQRGEQILRASGDDLRKIAESLHKQDAEVIKQVARVNIYQTEPKSGLAGFFGGVNEVVDEAVSKIVSQETFKKISDAIQDVIKDKAKMIEEAAKLKAKAKQSGVTLEEAKRHEELKSQIERLDWKARTDGNEYYYEPESYPEYSAAEFLRDFNQL